MEGVELLRRAADELLVFDPEELSGEELGGLLVELERQKARLLAGQLHVVRSFDQLCWWQADGSRSAASWLARQLRAPLGAMRRLTRLGKRLPRMAGVAEALASGDISGDHADVLAKVAGSPRRPVRECYDDAEEMLVRFATELDFEDFVASVKHWEDVVDQDGAEERAASDHEARHLHVSQTFRGNWRLDGQLDAIGGTEFDEALRRIDDELFKDDWDAAKAIHGEDTRGEHLARSAAQRRADALIEMARRATTAPADGKRPRPLINVHLGDQALRRLCELAIGTPVTPGQMVPLIREADIERIVYQGTSRKVIDLGAKSRLFTGALRRAIQLRDRRCVEPGCRVPADRCEADHGDPHSLGGETSQENGKCRCRGHHRHKSRTDGSNSRPPPDTS